MSEPALVQSHHPTPTAYSPFCPLSAHSTMTINQDLSGRDLGWPPVPGEATQRVQNTWRSP